MFTEQVTIRRRTVSGTDAYGNDVYEDVDAVSDAWWEPRTSGEQTDARNQVTSGYWLYLREGTQIDAQSTVRIDGVWHEVVGEPGRQPGGYALDGYIRTAVEKVTG